MYIKRVEINNIRAIEQLVWQLPNDSEGGWHVVIGDNSSGKTTFLQSIALSILGAEISEGLRQNWSEWLNHSVSSDIKASIKTTCTINQEYDHFFTKEAKNNFEKYSRDIYSSILKDSNSETDLREKLGNFQIAISKLPNIADILSGVKKPRFPVGIANVDNTIHIRNIQSMGWFICSFGPFRRFKGGHNQYDNINQKLQAHISLFDEGVALKEAFSWLQTLHYKELESISLTESSNQNIISTQTIIDFINSGELLPHGITLNKITSDGLIFIDSQSNIIDIHNLSDGFRSILSLVLELLRQLFNTYSADIIFDKPQIKVIVPGVVMIDEIDAHLHPSWQKRIGLWFRKHFPNMQFIVTTHNPIICQAVAAGGSVFKLPKPNSAEEGYMVEGTELNRLVYGNVLDAYSTELFGEDVSQSEYAQEKLDRLARLNQKELHDGLNQNERKEQKELRSTFPTSSFPAH